MTKERLIPLIVATALFMENMDSTVIATSLPAIAADIGSSPLTLKLAITSYLLSLAVFIPASGWTADRFGARMVFSVAVLVFMIGSIGCALSHTVANFVFARILQGIGGAMMTPVGRLVLLRSIDKSALVGAMAWVTVPALVGPVIGPPLGGFITTYFSWHWIFLINIPIGLLGIFMAMRYIDPIRSEDPERFDLYGLVLAGVGLGGSGFALSVAGLNLLPWTIVAALVAIGSISMTLYVIHGRRTASPVLDFTLMRLPTFRASIIGGFLFRLGIGALPFLLPLLMQVGFGLSPFRSGLVTFASAVGAMGMKTLAARIIRTFGFRNVMMTNAIVSSAFLAACGLFTVTTPLLLIMIILVVGGFFRSLQFTAINTVAYAEVEPAQMSRATTLVSVNQQLAISAGVAIGAFSVESTMLVRHVQELSAADFAPAFLVVAFISTISAYFFYKMPIDAGHQVSGRRVVVISEPTREQEAEEEAASETVTARDQRLGYRDRPASINPVLSLLASKRVATKSHRKHVALGGILPARCGLHMPDAGVVAFQLRHQRRIRAALKHLGDKRAPGVQHFAGKSGRAFHQTEYAQLVGFAMARGVGCHVREHHVGAAAHHRKQFRGCVVALEIKLREIDARDLRHLEQIDRDHPALAAGRANSFGGDLAPTAGRGAQIDHRDAVLQEMVLVVDLDQLERRTRAQAFALGLCHVGIVELPLQPKLRGQLALASGLDRDVQSAGGIFRHNCLACPLRAIARYRDPLIAPSSRIISTSMPSRSPRSATRSRGSGNALRMASRIAQPARTRSARSALMQLLLARS